MLQKISEKWTSSSDEKIAENSSLTLKNGENSSLGSTQSCNSNSNNRSLWDKDG
jgi:hypothetical protein